MEGTAIVQRGIPVAGRPRVARRHPEREGRLPSIRTVSVSEEPPTPRPWLSTPAYEQDPEFSPDGRWMLYSSSTSGRREVYAQPHGREAAATQVSAEAGYSPSWNPDGRELFYVSRRGAETVLMAVEVTGGPTPRFGPARPLFPMEGNTRTRRYDVAPGRGRFLDVRDAPREQAPPPVTHALPVELPGQQANRNSTTQKRRGQHAGAFLVACLGRSFSGCRANRLGRLGMRGLGVSTTGRSRRRTGDRRRRRPS